MGWFLSTRFTTPVSSLRLCAGLTGARIGVRKCGAGSLNGWSVSGCNLDPTHSTRFPDDARQQIAADFKRSAPQIVHTIDGIIDLTPQLSEITAPCLVLWGKRDVTLNPAFYPRLVSGLPNAQGFDLPGCGHQPHIEQAQTVNFLVTKYFDQLIKPELSTHLVNSPIAGD